MKRLMWWSWGGIAGLAVILAVVAYVAWPPKAVPEVPRAHLFRDINLCLLTGHEGINAGGPAATTWTGLQKVAKETNVQVNWVPVSGDQSEARAGQFVATLVQQRCLVIVAVGQAQVAAAKAAEAQYPAVKFVTVSDSVTSDEVSAKVRPLIPA